MINWCIEKPNQGEKIDSDSESHESAGNLHLLVQQRFGARAWKILIASLRGHNFPHSSSASDRHEGTVSI